MNKRDSDLLTALLVKLEAHFSDPKKMAVAITRGEARATIAAIRERKALEAETPNEEGKLL